MQQGTYEVDNTTLSDAEDGSFSVVAENNQSKDAAPWSPCFARDQTHLNKIQIGHQTHLYLGEQEGAKNPVGTVDKDWTEKMTLVWEECDPAVDTYDKWGFATQQ